MSGLSGAVNGTHVRQASCQLSNIPTSKLVKFWATVESRQRAALLAPEVEYIPVFLLPFFFFLNFVLSPSYQRVLNQSQGDKQNLEL